MMECLCPAPRTLACRVVLLDERELFHEIQVCIILLISYCAKTDGVPLVTS